MAPSRPLRLAAIAVVVAGLGLSACGDDNDAPSTTSTTATTATTVAGVTTTSTAVATTTTTAAAAGKTFQFTFAGGNVSGDSRVTAKLGEQVTIRVTSDVAEEVHVHTYDLTADLEPGVAGEVTFTADIPGVHEVELEHAGLHLTSLEVQ